MYEKLIEHWLTNVNELGFQLPLCEVLLSEGYTILHVSRHGRGEHGKDIIARAPDGGLATFQLKGGDINLGKWQEIRGEVEDLVRLPVMLPGIDPTEPHVPYLVTNGELRGDAPLNMREYAEDWNTKGSGLLQIWQKNELLQKFVAAHGAYIPSKSLKDFRTFVELYVGEFAAIFPRERFCDFVFSLYPLDARPTERKRALESAILTGEYIVAQYEQAGNVVAALEGWTILAALILHAAERDALPADAYSTSLRMITTAFNRNADRFVKEVVASENFLSSQYMIAEDTEIRGARTVLILGWLAALWLRARDLGEPFDHAKQAADVMQREYRHLKVSGEADWPYIVAVALFVESDSRATGAEILLKRWIDAVLQKNEGSNADGLPSPYWLQEKALSLGYGKVPPADRESFRHHSYTVHSALDMLVRRLCRQAVAGYWKRVSKLTFCDFVPEQGCDWFVWRCRTGESRMMLFPLSASWSKWRAESGTIDGKLLPQVLLRHSEWILPFAFVFPHRMNRTLTTLVDAKFGGRAEVS